MLQADRETSLLKKYNYIKPRSHALSPSEIIPLEVVKFLYRDDISVSLQYYYLVHNFEWFTRFGVDII